MVKLSASVRRLGADLRRISGGPGPTRREIEQLQDRVADLLLRALSDEHHPVADQLADLQDRIRRERQGTLYRPDVNLAATSTRKQATPRDSLRHLFMPHPGASDAEARRLWHLQLLLQTAARSPAHGTRLAERLDLSQGAMKDAVELAAGSSVAMWTQTQYAQLLGEAVDSLNFPDPPLQFRLEGQDFIHQSGKTVQLSPQEANFLRLLVDRAGQPVPRAVFREARIAYPAQVKDRLLRRLRAAGIELHIASAAGLYTLLTSEQ